MRFVLLIWLLTAGLSSATLLPAPALAQVVCSGHKLLSSPRPESSCSSIKPRIYPSPDGALRALVLPRRYQPLRHAGYGKPRRDPDQQRRYRDLEGLLVAARHQLLLCRQCKMVAGFAILCLQHGVIGWSFALVIPDDGVQPGEETHRWIERHDRWGSRRFRRISALPARIRSWLRRGKRPAHWTTRFQSQSISRMRSASCRLSMYSQIWSCEWCDVRPWRYNACFAAAQNLVDAFGCVGNYCSLLTSTGAVGCGEIPPVKQQRGAGI